MRQPLLVIASASLRRAELRRRLLHARRLADAGRLLVGALADRRGDQIGAADDRLRLFGRWVGELRRDLAPVLAAQQAGVVGRAGEHELPADVEEGDSAGAGY